MLNLLTSLLFVAALGAVAWWARRHEPHWVDRDGSRFLCRARLLDARGGRPGRWQPVRGGIGTGGIILQAGLTGNRAINGVYSVGKRIADDHHGHVIYGLDGTQLVALRVPAGSRLVPVLDAMSAGI